jgi:uncharacterized protein YjbI with pentapeptide repeats
LHDSSLDKNLDLFNKAIEDTLNDTEAEDCDFRGVIFPYSTESFSNIHLHKKIIFDKSQFMKASNFHHSKFDGGSSFENVIFNEIATFDTAYFGPNCNFSKAKFRRAAIFSNAIFEGVCSFQSCQFEFTINFNHTMFLGKTNFNNCAFMQDSIFTNTIFHNILDFQKAIFRRTVDFGNAEFLSNTSFADVQFFYPPYFNYTKFRGRASFFGSSFSNKEVTLNRCDLSKLIFHGLPQIGDGLLIKRCRWAKKFNLIPSFGRIFIEDEIVFPGSEKVIDKYRKLQKYFYDSCYFDLAREFYIGFMICKRKAAKRTFWVIVFDFIYSVISRYGESITRPILTLILMWLIVPIILLIFGIKLNPESPASLDTRFYITFDFKDFLLLTSEYWDAFKLNLSLSTIIRSNSLRPPITSWQNTILLIETFLNILFVSFIALGIKRHFTPRKPSDIQ